MMSFNTYMIVAPALVVVIMMCWSRLENEQDAEEQDVEQNNEPKRTEEKPKMDNEDIREIRVLKVEKDTIVFKKKTDLLKVEELIANRDENFFLTTKKDGETITELVITTDELQEQLNRRELRLTVRKTEED